MVQGERTDSILVASAGLFVGSVFLSKWLSTSKSGEADDNTNTVTSNFCRVCRSLFHLKRDGDDCDNDEHYHGVFHSDNLDEYNLLKKNFDESTPTTGGLEQDLLYSHYVRRMQDRLSFHEVPDFVQGNHTIEFELVDDPRSATTEADVTADYFPSHSKKSNWSHFEFTESPIRPERNHEQHHQSPDGGRGRGGGGGTINPYWRNSPRHLSLEGDARSVNSADRVYSDSKLNSQVGGTENETVTATSNASIRNTPSSSIDALPYASASKALPTKPTNGTTSTTTTHPHHSNSLGYTTRNNSTTTTITNNKRTPPPSSSASFLPTIPNAGELIATSLPMEMNNGTLGFMPDCELPFPQASKNNVITLSPKSFFGRAESLDDRAVFGHRFETECESDTSSPPCLPTDASASATPRIHNKQGGKVSPLHQPLSPPPVLPTIPLKPLNRRSLSQPNLNSPAITMVGSFGTSGHYSNKNRDRSLSDVVRRQNLAARAHYNARIMPHKLVLVRHGQSAGNIDERLYATVPDNAMPLTKLGWEQARAAGKHLKEVVLKNPENVHFIVSPYVRSVETFHGIVSAWCDPAEFQHISNRELRLQAWYSRLLQLGLTWHEDPRIREQDFGNYQNAEAIKKAKRDRHGFGSFYYRFQNGESASDVFDRISTFLDSLWRSFDLTNARNYVLVTHGISIRVLLMRYFRYTIDQFHLMANPRNCEMMVLTHDGLGRLDLSGRYELELEDDKETGEKRVVGSRYHERLRVQPSDLVRRVHIRISYDDL